MGVTFDSKMTFEKHLRSVSRAASQRKLGFVLSVLEYCSAVWCSAADTHLKLLDRAVSGARFLTGVCLSVTFLTVEPWQSCVCFIRSGVARCTLLMVLYLDRMCQGGLNEVLWSHIGTLTHRLAAEPCSTAGLLFPSRCPSGTILLTRILWYGTGGFQEQGQCFSIGLSCSISTIVFYSFSRSLLSVY